MRGHGHGRFGRQRRGRQMLRPSLLLIMHESPAHGYELLERLKRFGLGDIDPSLIYRALREMEIDGLVRSQWEEEKTQGPPRRVYTLTAAGDQILREHMRELMTTRQQIDQLLQAYEKHMASSEGNFHNRQKGE